MKIFPYLHFNIFLHRERDHKRDQQSYIVVEKLIMGWFNSKLLFNHIMGSML